MNRIAVFVLLMAVTLPGGASGMTVESYHTKLLPESVSYPMIRPGVYPYAGGDTYAATFGTVRLFKSVVPSDYDTTVREALHFNKLYGAYGVLGHGEDVFTARADRFRNAHQGRGR
jgi:hypothetical protein